jgi:hypothetical protein
MLWKSAQWGSWMQVLFYFAINLQGKLTEASPWPFQICKRRRWDFLKFGPAQDFNSRTVLSPALSKIVQSFFQGVAAGLIYPTWPLVVQSCCLCSSIKSCFVGCWIWMDMRYIMVCIYICYIFGISEYLKTLPRLQDSFHLFPIASTDLNWLFKWPTLARAILDCLNEKPPPPLQVQAQRSLPVCHQKGQRRLAIQTTQVGLGVWFSKRRGLLPYSNLLPSALSQLLPVTIFKTRSQAPSLCQIIPRNLQGQIKTNRFLLRSVKVHLSEHTGSKSSNVWRVTQIHKTLEHLWMIRDIHHLANLGYKSDYKVKIATTPKT